MLGLLQKELIQSKKLLLTYTAVTIFFMIYSFISEDMSFVSTMLPFLGFMMAIGSLSSEDDNSWNKYTLTMPVKSSSIVYTKYISTFIYLAPSCILAFICMFIFHFVLDVDITKDLSMTFILICYATFMLSILIPIYIKLDPAKARMWMVAVCVIPAFAMMGGARILEALNIELSLPDIETILSTVKFAIPVVLIVTLVLCINISVRIQNRKEY